MIKDLKTSLTDLPKLAKQTAMELRGGEILALVGPLGSGKTTFTKLLGKELGVRNTITSPTFIVMNRYRGKLRHPQEKSRRVYLYHLDLYRTKNFQEVKALGLTELWGRSDTITVIEWADKIKPHLPKNALSIIFTPLPGRKK